MPDFNNYFDKLKVKVVTAEDFDSAQKYLLYGAAGTGKSSLAYSASLVPELCPVLGVDIEHGSMPALKHGDMNNLTILRPNSFTEVKKIINMINEPDFPFKCVVFDTADKFQEMVLRHWGKISDNAFEKWTQAYEQLVILMDAIKAKGITVIAITHVDRVILEGTGEKMIGPAFEGKVSPRKIPSDFDVVGYMHWEEIDEDNVIPVLVTRTGEDIIVKQRFDMPDILGEPTMTKITEYYKIWKAEYLEKESANE